MNVSQITQNLELKLEQVNDYYAVFSTVLGLEARLPRNLLPEGARTGEIFQIKLMPGHSYQNTAEEESKLKQMRKLLEELIN